MKIFSIVCIFLFCLITPVFALESNDPYQYQWAYDDIGVYDAWDITTGSSEIVVAILDNGFDTFHDELKENAWKNIDEIPNNMIDDDNNGYIDDVWGWNFIPEDRNGDGEIDEVEQLGNNDPRSRVNNISSQAIEDGLVHHGTLVAGIIGAKGNNTIDGAGLNWDVQLMNVKIIKEDGWGDIEVAARAVRYAVDNGADIINMSIVGHVYSESLEKSIEYAHDNDVIVVAAAGNEGINMNILPQYPVCFDSQKEYTSIIGVSAVDRAHFFASFSNGGSECIDITAPGVNISSTLRFDADNNLDKQYGGNWNGTSFAAPFVSGAVALVKSIQPFWDAQQIIEALFSSVHRTTPNDDQAYANLYGNGFLQVGSLIDYANTFVNRYDLLGFLVFDDEKSIKSDFEHEIEFEAPPLFISESLLGMKVRDEKNSFIFTAPVEVGLHSIVYSWNSETQVTTPLILNVRNIEQWFIGDFLEDSALEYVFVTKDDSETSIMVFDLNGKKILKKELEGSYSGKWKVYSKKYEKNKIVFINKSETGASVNVFSDTFGLSQKIVLEGYSDMKEIIPVNFDEDDEVEVAFIAKKNRYQLYFADDNGSAFRYFSAYTENGIQFAHMFAGDIDNDGVDDILTYNKDNNYPVRVWNTKGKKLYEYFSEPFNKFYPIF
jgi:thermitase